MDDLNNLTLMDTPLINSVGMMQLLMHFLFNVIVVFCLVHFFYYSKSKRKDYYFTFNLIGVSIFLLIFLLGSVKLKVGFALGLFAIFGIIRYRTESVPIREMTYLFIIIAISAINAMAAAEISYIELLLTNAIFIVSVWICESNRWIKHISYKFIYYDKIDLIKPQKKSELISDIECRTGLSVLKVEVGHIDFIRDSAIIKVYYEPEGDDINTIDTLTKIPRENEQ